MDRLEVTPPSSPSIRVLWLIKQLGVGGAERLLVGAAGAHDRRAFDFQVAYVIDWNDALAEELRQMHVPVHSLGVGRAADLRWVLRLRRLLKEGRFNVVHAHSPVAASVCRLLVRTLKPSARPHLVATEHATWHSYRLPTRLLNFLTMPLDDVHIAVSEHTRAAMPSVLRAKTRVVVHGVPVKELRALRAERETRRLELAVTDEQVLMVSVANMVPDKRYPDLLRAAAIVVDACPTATFLAIGREGPGSKDLYALHQQLNLGERFRFLGFRADAVALLAGADVFVLSSGFEGYPVAVMEALALGVPVVGTAVGGVPDAVRDGIDGRVVPPRDHQRLAAAIIELVNDRQLRLLMADSALERGDTFEMRRATSAIEAIYRELARLP